METTSTKTSSTKAGGTKASGTKASGTKAANTETEEAPFLSTQYFDKMYDESNWWHDARLRILEDLVSRTLEGRAVERILDVGCGSGHIMKMLSRYGRVDGVDELPDEMVRDLESPRIRILRGRFPEAVPEGRVYDAVTMFDVIEHVADDDAFLEAVHRVLKPHGLLFLTVPAYMFLWGPLDELNRHCRRYRRRALGAQLEKADFEILKLSYYNSLLLPPIIFVRAARNLFFKRGTKPSIELNKPVEPANTILKAIFASERHLLPKIDFPAGASILGVARSKR